MTNVFSDKAQSLRPRLIAALALACAIMLCLLLAAPCSAYAADDGQVTAGTTTNEQTSTITVGGTQAGQTAPKTTQPKYAKVKKVKLNKKNATIKNNGKLKLKATLVPDIAGKKIKNKKIKWSVSNKKIASITQKGVVQGKTAGTVIVTAKASNGKKAKAKIKVIIEKNKMARGIPVLTYHRICSDWAKRHIYDDTNIAMSASLFNRQMKWLKSHGYRTVSTEEFRDWRNYGAFLHKKSVLITIDDGYYETYHVAYPILKKYNLKATSFVIGEHVGKTTMDYDPKVHWDRYMGWDVINKIREEYPKLEFQSHTYAMHHRGRAYSWSRKRIDADFAKNEVFGFTSMAYPFGHNSRNLMAAARANKNIKLGFGYLMWHPATRNSPRYNIPRYKVFGDRGLYGFIDIVNDAY